jgi:hypothetical protein
VAFIPARGLATIADIAASAKRLRSVLGRVQGAGLDLDEVSLAKLRWLERDDRDFRASTPQLQTAMGAAYAREAERVFAGAQPDDGAPVVAAVTVYRDAISQRLLKGGGDVTVRPLAASTIKRKGNAHVGVATGDLQRAVANARVRNTRTT